MLTRKITSLLQYLDWLALCVGTVGTILWAHNGRLAKYAAVWWLVSSLLWMWFAYLKGLSALGARDLISVGLYLYGGYRWLRPNAKVEVSAQTPTAETPKDA